MARSTLIALTGLLLAGCGLFAPPKITGDDAEPPPPDSTTAQSVMDNLERAFDKRDRILYETSSTTPSGSPRPTAGVTFSTTTARRRSCGSWAPATARPTGSSTSTAPSTGSSTPPGATPSSAETAPTASRAIPTGTPTRTGRCSGAGWRSCCSRRPDEGYYVDQVMTFKMRKGDDDLWRIVRWLDDPAVHGLQRGRERQAGRRPSPRSRRSPLRTAPRLRQAHARSALTREAVSALRLRSEVAFRISKCEIPCRDDSELPLQGHREARQRLPGPTLHERRTSRPAQARAVGCRGDAFPSSSARKPARGVARRPRRFVQHPHQRPMAAVIPFRRRRRL